MGEDNGSVRLRSIYVSQPGSEEDGGKGIVGIRMGAEPQSQDFLENGVERRMEEASDQDEKQALEPITLPESTHTLLFTEKTCSLPYFFSLGIIVLSMICLTLVFINNIRDARAGNILSVPVGVSVEVMVAQYASILVALLMEEGKCRPQRSKNMPSRTHPHSFLLTEIPTGLFLLRGVPYQSFKQKFPDLKYRPFVSCAILRIIMGYFFLLNVLIVLVQADEVISIFYDGACHIQYFRSQLSHEMLVLISRSPCAPVRSTTRRHSIFAMQNGRAGEEASTCLYNRVLRGGI